jgi:AcrR family transcriptional regulator
VTRPVQAPSARRAELLELAYRHVLAHGLADMSLRPLAQAVGSSPRVLLFLFGSKDELVRALLDRARADELAALAALAALRQPDLPAVAAGVWDWLADPERRGLLTLWVESYARSLVDPAGPWGDFARRTVEDWLALFGAAQTPAVRRTRAGAAERTLMLAVLRGAMLDLLATGDTRRATAAVRRHLAAPGSEVPAALSGVGRA